MLCTETIFQVHTSRIKCLGEMAVTHLDAPGCSYTTRLVQSVASDLHPAAPLTKGRAFTLHRSLPGELNVPRTLTEGWPTNSPIVKRPHRSYWLLADLHVKKTKSMNRRKVKV
jgi:hypothetical protein